MEVPGSIFIGRATTDDPNAVALTVDLLEIDPIDLDDPPANIDGLDMTGGETFLAVGQEDPIENGAWVYNGPGVPATRDPGMPADDLIYSPYIVEILFGDEYGGTFWALQEESAIIGQDPNTWMQTDEAGVVVVGTALMGGRLPYKPPAEATQRALYAADAPPYRPDRLQSMWWQSIYLNLNNFFFMSKANSPSTPYADQTLLRYGLTRYPAVIVDRPLRMPSGIALSGIRNGTLVFPFGSAAYPNVIMPRSLTFLNISGSRNFTIDGDIYAKYSDTGGGSTKFILGTSGFTNFKADGIYTEGAPFNFSVVLAADDPDFNNTFDIDWLGVDSGTPIDVAGAGWLAFSAGRGWAASRLGSVTNLANVYSNNTIVNQTINPWQNGNIIDLAGTLAAPRNLTLTLENMTRGFRWRIRRSGGGASAWTILNPGPAAGTATTLATGEQCVLALNTTTGNLFVEQKGTF